MKGLKKFSKKKQKLFIKISKTTTRKKELKYKTYKSLFEKVRKKLKQPTIQITDSKWTWQVMKEISGKQKSEIKSPFPRY